MTMLPAGLRKKLSVQDRAELLAWWGTLAEREQREVRRLYSHGADKRLLPLQAGQVQLVGRFVDGDEASLTETRSAARYDFDWLAENPHRIPTQLSIYESNQADSALSYWNLLEFVSNHEDVGFFLGVRTAHVCRAHEEARRVLCDGLLPASFVCPLQRGSCPMKNLLAISPGKSLRISWSV